MILVDANLLLYAYNLDAPQNTAARSWLESVLSGRESVAFSWPTILAFLRITTHPRVFPHPYTMAEATSVIRGWLARRAAVILASGPDHWAVLERMLLEGQVRGAVVMDAHLAALAIEHGATLYSTDRDFTRFPGLRLVNPLAPL
ncbi:MAG: PIN domain-containing protein [Chloroflexi bacterium]|nr:PIN domain-containing protein [Chloroflexota bacterium]